jgi:hypothetical protein
MSRQGGPKQIQMTKIQMTETLTRLEHWKTRPVECRLLAALPRRIPQGENFGFVSDFGFNSE